MHWAWQVVLGVVGTVAFVGIVTVLVYLGEMWGQCYTKGSKAED